MMRGRKTIPDHIKLLRGTQKPSRVNRRQPKPIDDLPKAPKELPKDAVEYFGRYAARLEQIGIASSTHTEALANLSIAAWKVFALAAIVEKEGFYVEIETEHGSTVRNHPAASQLADAQRALDALTSKFGLDPSSQGKVSVPKKEKGDSPYAEFATL